MISNKGRVKTAEGYLIKAHYMTSGYLYFNGVFKDGKQVHTSIHRAVLSSFCPVDNMDSLIVNHKDFNRKNNDLSNLEWVTHRENTRHALDAGRKNPDENKKCRLKVAQKLHAIELFNSGMSVKDVSIAMTTPYKYMHAILKGSRKNSRRI